MLGWNVHHIARTVVELRRQGYPVDDADMAWISPLWFKDILVHGIHDDSDTRMVQLFERPV